MVNPLMNNEITNQQTRPKPNVIDPDALPETVNTAGMVDSAAEFSRAAIQLPAKTVESFGMTGGKGDEDRPYALNEEGTSVLSTGDMAEQSIRDQQKTLTIDEFKSQIGGGQIKRIGKDDENYLRGLLDTATNPKSHPKHKKRAETKLEGAYNRFLNTTEGPSQYVTFGKKVAPGTFEFSPSDDAVFEGEDSALFTVQENIFRGKQRIAQVVFNRFDKTGLDLEDQKRIENIFIRNLSNGNFWDTTVEKLYDGGVRGLNWAIRGGINYGAHAIGALMETVGSGIAAGLTERQFRGFMEQWKDGKNTREATTQFWNKNLSGRFAVQELSGAMNDMVRDGLKQQLIDGEITKEDYERIVQQTIKIPDSDETETLQRRFIDEELAQSLLNDSVNNLSGSEQYAAVLIETMVSMLGVGKFKKAAGIKTQKKVKTAVDLIIEKARDPQGSEFYKSLAGQLVGKTPLQQARILKTNKQISSFNEKSLLYAMGLDRVDDNMKRLAKDRDELSYRMREIRRDGGDINGSEYRSLEMQYNQLTNRTITKYVTGRVFPSLKENFVEAVPMSFFMHNFGSLTGLFEDDRLAAEGFGGLAYILVGKPMANLSGKGAYWLNQQGGDVVNKVYKGFDAMADYVVSTGTGGRVRLKGFFADRDIDAYAKWYEGETGNKLSVETRKSLQYVGRLSDAMTDDARDQVVDNMVDHQQRLDRILSEFDSTIKIDVNGNEYSERSMMAEDLKQTFASQTGLTWMQAAAELNRFSISARSANSLAQVTDTTQQTLAAMNGLDASKRLLKKLQERSMKSTSGFTGEANLRKTPASDPASQSELSKFTDALSVSVQQQEKALSTAKTTMIKQIQDYRAAVLADPKAELPANVTEILNANQVELELSVLTDVSGEGAIDAVKRHAELAEESRLLLAERARNASSFRKDVVAHKRMTSRNLEIMMHDHLSAARKRAKRGFKKVDAMAAKMGATVDISDMVTALKGFSPDEGMELARFFRRDSKFFMGTLGKKAYTAMNRIAVNSLKSLEGQSYEQLVELATNPDSPHFIRESGVRPLDIALYWQSREGSSFKGLVATPGEVMDVYSAFRDYAVRTNDASLASVYQSYADTVSNTVKQQAPEIHAAWEEARTTYKKEWFERLRVGGPLAMVHKSQVGDIKESAKVDNPDGSYLEEFGIGETIPEGKLIASMTNVAYRGTTPYDAFDPIIKRINTALSGDKQSADEAFDEIVLMMDELTQEFSDEVSGSVFDTTTGDGLAKLELLRANFTELVYSKWGADVMSELGDASDLDIEAIKTGGYNFSRIERIKNLQDALTVAVRGADGTIKRETLVDLTTMAEQERGIHKLIQLETFDTLALNRYQNEIASSLDAVVRKVGGDLTGVMDLGMKEIRSIDPDTTPQQFLQKYVIGHGPEKLERLRDTLLLKLGDKFTVKVEGKPDIVYDTEEIIDSGIKNLLINGILDHGGSAPIPGRMSTGLNGQKYVNEGMYTPQNIIKMFENEEMVETLGRYIDPDHQQFILDIAEQLSLAATSGAVDSSIASQIPKITNVMKPMGINQLISRSFNLARGMVSPTYVAAELGVSLASQAGLDMMKMAAGNKEASDLMLRLIKYPKTMTKADLDTFDNLVKGFIVTELGTLGILGQQKLEGLFVEVDNILAQPTDVDQDDKPRINPAVFPEEAKAAENPSDYYATAP